MNNEYLKTVIENLDHAKEYIQILNSTVDDLMRENDRLRDENAKLLIDVAFFDGKLPSSTKGTQLTFQKNGVYWSHSQLNRRSKND